MLLQHVQQMQDNVLADMRGGSSAQSRSKLLILVKQAKRAEPPQQLYLAAAAQARVGPHMCGVVRIPDELVIRAVGTTECAGGDAGPCGVGRHVAEETVSPVEQIARACSSRMAKHEVHPRRCMFI